MAQFINSIQLPADAKPNFVRDGFIKLDGFVQQESLHQMIDIFDKEIEQREENPMETPLDKHMHYGNFSGVTDRINGIDDLAGAICNAPGFRQVASVLDEKRWLFSHALAFEMLPMQTGLDWHFGFRSFNYVRPEDMGYSLWVPLDPIDANGQRGGMSVVSENHYSGREETKLLAQVCRNQSDPALVKTAYDNLEGFCNLRNAVLNKHEVEYSFNVGDALLFNRYVFHRSCQLQSDGPLQRRRALVLRFVHADARMDRELLRSQTELFGRLRVNNPPGFGIELEDIADGELIFGSNAIQNVV